MLRPSNEDFFEWFKNGSNVSRIRDSLNNYPDLVRIKERVRCITSVVIAFLVLSAYFP